MEAPAAPLYGGSNNVDSSRLLLKELNAEREETVRKFALLLSTKTDDSQKGNHRHHAAARSNGLASLISDSVADDAVVLELPSLDMRACEEHSKNGGALPKLGETNKEPDNTGATSFVLTQSSRDGRPNMAASVLTAASNDAAKLEEKAAIEMGKKTSWTRSTVVYATQALASNASEFFAKLIDSRLRAWTLLLLRHSLSTGDTQSRTRLLSMLSASIQVKKAETNFKTLSLPEAAAGQVKVADVILPLLFEVVLHLDVQGKPEAITLRAPGTISAYFDNNNAIRKVSTRIDTGVMLTAMVDHARIIVFKAVANATKTQVPSNQFASMTNFTGASSQDDPAGEALKAGGIISMPQAQNPPGLSRFRSALNLSSAPRSGNESPSLQKARCSALRLNSVLHGKGSETKNTPLTGPRQVRSVKWDSPLQLPKLTSALAPSPKKQRVVDNAAKLKSFKSFGRPHAGDFGSGPRNATFGEYGGRAHLWGRDGRLAHHPAPMQASGGHMMDQVGLTGVPDKNATFDLFRQNKPSASLAPQATSSSMPRTTTGLEKWLISSSTRS